MESMKDDQGIPYQSNSKEEPLLANSFDDLESKGFGDKGGLDEFRDVTLQPKNSYGPGQGYNLLP